MESLKLKWEPVRGQKFDIGRTINPIQCSGCKSCDFMNCKNYAKKMTKGKYTIQEWFDNYSKEMTFSNWEWDRDLLNELFDSLIVHFPKGLYWNPSYDTTKIEFVNFTRSGKERIVGTINLKTYEIWNYDLSETQEKFLNKIVKTLKAISDMYKTKCA